MPAEVKPPAASNVIPFDRDQVKESPLAKQLRAMNAAQAEFWRQDAARFEQLRKKHGGERALKIMAAARKIVDAGTLKAGETSHALAVVVSEGAQEKQRESAKQPRPQRSTKNADRDQRIRKAFEEGKSPKEIGGAENLSAVRVRAILGRT